MDILNLLIDSKSHLSSRSLSVSTSPILSSKASQLEEVFILCKRRNPAWGSGFPIWFVLPFKILKICFSRGRQRSATELTESFFTGFYWRLRLVNTRSSLEEVFFQIWNICQSLKKFLARLRSSTGHRELFYPRFAGIAQLRPIGSWINLMETFSFFKTIGAILVWYLFHRNLQISGGKLHISTTWRK